MTDSASIGRRGDSRRDHSLRLGADVFGCVYIPVVQSAALVTAPRPDIQRHGRLRVHATRASLARRVKAIHANEALTSTRSLIFSESGEHAPPGIADGFRKAVVVHHAVDVQILDGDHLVFVN